MSRCADFIHQRKRVARYIDSRVLAQLSPLAVIYRLGFAVVLSLGVSALIPGNAGWFTALCLLTFSSFHIGISVVLGNSARPKYQEIYSVVVYGAAITTVIVLPTFPIVEDYEELLRLLVVVGAVAIGAGGTLRFVPTMLSLLGGGVAGFGVLHLMGDMPSWMVIHRSYSLGVFLACFAALMRENQNRQLYLGQALLEKEKRSYEQLAKEMRALTQVDPLTGLSNRRYLEERLAYDWSTARETQRLVSVMFVDIDHFKKYNDFYGHLAGDTVINTVADTLQRVARRSGDLAARFGGEEFILTSIQRDKESLERHAESLRVAVQTLNIEHEESPFGLITISIGLSCAVPNEDGRYESLLHMADLALYEAKAAGRNRVESSWNLVRR